MVEFTGNNIILASSPGTRTCSFCTSAEQKNHLLREDISALCSPFSEPKNRLKGAQ